MGLMIIQVVLAWNSNLIKAEPYGGSPGLCLIILLIYYLQDRAVSCSGSLYAL